MIEISDRSQYPFAQWSGFVTTSRPDVTVYRFDGEREAIDRTRHGDEVYRLEDAWAIVRPVTPNVTGTLTVGKNYLISCEDSIAVSPPLSIRKAYPVLDKGCKIPFEDEETAIASGKYARIEFDGEGDR